MKLLKAMEVVDLGEEGEEVGESLSSLELDSDAMEMVREDPSVCSQVLLNAYLTCVITICS